MQQFIQLWVYVYDGNVFSYAESWPWWFDFQIEDQRNGINVGFFLILMSLYE